MMRWSRTLNLTAAMNFHEGALVANYPWDGTHDSKTRYARVGCCNLKLGETRVETRVESAWS